nr:retrovirus-related Pol polyprotein from transposon TNT 1-94 [Tanacetum cinerariifolium]
MIATHVECHEKYAKLEEEIYEYMIRYSALFDNDKQHRKQIDDQEVLFDKMTDQLVELDIHVRDLKNTILEKNFKISELEECVRNKDLEIEKCLEPLNVCENKIHKMDHNQTVQMIMPSKDILYNGRKGIDLDTFSSVRRPKNSGFIWKKKGSSNTSNDDLSAIVKIYLWIIDSGCSKHMTGNRSLLTNFVKKFLGTVRFGNNDFTMIAGYGDVVIGSMTIKKVYYVEVVVDDYSRYTWVFFFHSKDEASEVIISFIKKTQVNLQLQVQRVQTDNGTEFKNKTLAKFFDEVGITQQFSAARTPQQNGVVERRNRTLVEAARTMLTFANLSSFLWAEAIATACFIQNHLIIHKRFDKTLYELMNNRKPNIKFFRVFGCRCYLLNDYEDVAKLKAKGDIGVFVRYSKESAAFRIYNKRTRKIYESVNVNFDEISEMASKQFSLEPGLPNLNEREKASNPSVSKVSEVSKKDLEDLFQDFYDEYFDSSKIMKSSTTNVETSINEKVFHEVSESFQWESSSSSLNDNVQ